MRSDQINSRLRAATARGDTGGGSETIPARAVPHLPPRETPADDAKKAKAKTKGRAKTEDAEKSGPTRFLDTPAVENIRARMEDYARRQAEKRAQRGRS